MRRSFLPFLCTVLCSLLLTTGCDGLFRGSVPDIPFVGERVVSLQPYNGAKEPLLYENTFYASSLLRSRYDGIGLNDTLYRHALLALYQEGGELGQQGMIGNLRDRAEADG